MHAQCWSFSALLQVNLSEIIEFAFEERGKLKHLGKTPQCQNKNQPFTQLTLCHHHNVVLTIIFGKKPYKLKFLPCRLLVTNSFGLRRLFYKSSRQFQNFRRHGDQNSHNLEG